MLNVSELIKLVDEFSIYLTKQKINDEVKENLKKDINKFHAAFLVKIEEEYIGYAILYTKYSSFKGKPILFLEDLYIKQNYRKGLGYKLFLHCLNYAKQKGYCFLEWEVLFSNKEVIKMTRKCNPIELHKERGLFRLDLIK
ncbi:MAG: GNAT family N-acetyltransferase [Pseudomonadota bacterium]